MTPYEWIGYCVAWAVAIACTALPVFILDWVLGKVFRAAGVSRNLYRVIREQGPATAISIHGWHWWRWKDVIEGDWSRPRPPRPDDEPEATQ